MKNIINTYITAIFLFIILSIPVNAHCQVPCGIYDDDARFNKLFEDAATIEKAMVSIRRLETAQGRTINQLVRWVNAKEEYADKISDTVCEYFLMQRIQPVPEGNKKAYQKYLKELELLHKVIVQAMYCKQTTDVNQVQKLRDALSEFKKLYNEK